MMGMGHYRGGGVGRIKGFVSQGCGWRAGRPAGRPYGDWTGAQGTYADGPFGQTLFPPPAHTSEEWGWDGRISTSGPGARGSPYLSSGDSGQALGPDDPSRKRGQDTSPDSSRSRGMTGKWELGYGVSVDTVWGWTYHLAWLKVRLWHSRPGG